MKRIAILVFMFGNMWWLIGWSLHHLLWPNDLCSHWPSPLISWILGTTTFKSGVDASLFWGCFQLLMFLAGLIAITTDLPDRQRNGRK